MVEIDVVRRDKTQKGFSISKIGSLSPVGEVLSLLAPASGSLEIDGDFLRIGAMKRLAGMTV